MINIDEYISGLKRDGALYEAHNPGKEDFDAIGKRILQVVDKSLITGSPHELGTVTYIAMGALKSYSADLAKEIADIEEAERIAQRAFELQNAIDAFITKTNWNACLEVEAAHNIAEAFTAAARAMREEKRIHFETADNPKAKFNENAVERLAAIFTHYFGANDKPTLYYDNYDCTYKGSLAPFANVVSAESGVELNLASLQSAQKIANKRNKDSGLPD